MGRRGTLPDLELEENVTTIQEHLKWRESDVNKGKLRRNRIAIALCLSLFIVGISGIPLCLSLVYLHIMHLVCRN